MANALTFPLPLEDFFGGLRVTTLGFDLTERMRHSETGGGEVLTSDLSPRLWRTTVAVGLDYHADQRAVEVKGSMLRQAGRSFFAGDVTAQYPATDPTGIILGSATPQIASVNGDRKRLSLKGLPANYEIPAGSFLSFSYGSPARYALHQVVSGVTAYGTGNTPLFEVMPFIRPGADVDTTVRLIRPYCKMVMVPGTWRGATRQPLISDGFTFEAIQTLR